MTTAFVTLFAVTECRLDSVTQKPLDYPSQSSEQLDWLGNLAHRLLDKVWMAPPPEDINAVAAAAEGDAERRTTFPFCFCREGRSRTSWSRTSWSRTSSRFNSVSSLSPYRETGRATAPLLQ